MIGTYWLLWKTWGDWMRWWMEVKRRMLYWAGRVVEPRAKKRWGWWMEGSLIFFFECGKNNILFCSCFILFFETFPEARKEGMYRACEWVKNSTMLMFRNCLWIRCVKSEFLCRMSTDLSNYVIISQKHVCMCMFLGIRIYRVDQIVEVAFDCKRSRVSDVEGRENVNRHCLTCRK